MTLLVVSDLHYSLRQYDWLLQRAGDHDLVIVAGDVMELASPVDADTQAAVIANYFRRMCRQIPVVVCSGNHDLVEEYDGRRTTEWLEELAIPGLVVDHGSYENDAVRILSLPWWDTDERRDRVEAWLGEQHEGRTDTKPVFWVNHVPPHGAKVSWNGKRDNGDPCLVRWIRRWKPAVVFSGHVHNAPYYPDGSWIDRVGDTVVINGGRQTGDKPATVELELREGSVVWCGMEGCERATLRLGEDGV